MGGEGAAGPARRNQRAGLARDLAGGTSTASRALKDALASRFGDAVLVREGVGAVSLIGAGINSTFGNWRRAAAIVAGLGCPRWGASTSSFASASCCPSRTGRRGAGAARWAGVGGIFDREASDDRGSGRAARDPWRRTVWSATRPGASCTHDGRARRAGPSRVRTSCGGTSRFLRESSDPRRALRVFYKPGPGSCSPAATTTSARGARGPKHR